MPPEFTRTVAGLAPAFDRGFRHVPPRRWWLNALLFVVTLLTTTAFGCALVESFARGAPVSFDLVIRAYWRLLHLDPGVFAGWRFSVPLLIILLAHEMGHYVECRRRGVDASLPYFLPSPTLFGTFGAFIRIRSPIYNREGLFDIGILGPLAGFVTLLPFLVAGVAMSKVGFDAAAHDVILLGSPLAVRWLELARFPGVPASHIVLHPMAVAAWAGLFATALNLLPIGQLDGGHIVYAVGREDWHRRISLAFVIVLACLGYFYWPWWVWSVILFFLGRRHPLVFDSAPLPRNRRLLCLAAILIFLLSASVVPVAVY